ncbi:MULTISPECIES: thioesterase family protein [Thermomonospora]|uniref:Acyl-CoA thioesterase n=1 Tax=Thermomonospora curvata (strain ATCC 19995 / DSM 43183 / JCM 3096 / KCTC 9072 / NBRC 15933 / NCIMB 10081 / Henssen B9) TaxID=471852 RepID=D1AD88_THECD|nr:MULTISPECIES: thioesterase family protein [Thermomonospora]ACY99397.1 conserved hypothetical protein [Thermomonospora curvata DSM 43183]PKK12443.1 MAG: thioesterase family protein [Thermomonospora sp. CIF 1]
MSRFGNATAVERVAEGRYEAELDAGFRIGEALNGGYLMAVLLRAAMDAAPHAHPISTSAAFLRVGRPGPAEITVEPRKSGRTAATVRATLSQDGQPVIDAQVVTGTLDPAAEPHWADQAPPALPPIDECVGRMPSPAKDRGFADRVDMRFDPATMGWLDGRPHGRLEMRGYFRLRDDDYAPDPFLLALAVDALPPVVLNTGFSGWAPTVELTWHMRALPAPGTLTLYGTGRLVRDGWFDEDVEVWDSAGRLVAQSRQIARVGRGSS